MLEKTKRFLKKEYGDRAEPNDDYCYYLWEEKAAIAEILFLEITVYIATVRYPRAAGKMRSTFNELLQDTVRAMDSDRQEEASAQYPANLSLSGDTYRIDINILKLFLAPKYELPSNPVDMILHILTIYRYYHWLLPSMGIHSWVTDAKVDLALLKLTQLASGLAYSLDKHMTKKDHATPGANKKKEIGSKSREAITKALEDLKIPNLQYFRKHKDVRDKFLKSTKEETDKLSPKRIYDLARGILKEKGTDLNTKPTV